jgi:hypothetical protein
MEFEYVCYPKPLNNRQVRYSRNALVQLALNSIVSPSESLMTTHPWYQKASAEAHSLMICYVAGSFYRLEFDSKCKIGKLPPCRNPEMKRQKKLVDACGLLWARTWRVFERMESMGRLPLPPFVLVGTISYPQQAITPTWLMALVLEGEILTPWADYVSPDGAQGSEALLKQQQNDNKSLQALENPFENPCTRLFIDSAIADAEKFDRFRTDFYNPMVRQRQAITALLKRESFVAFDLDGKPSRKGRKK